jgi:serine protease SohB
MLELLLNFVLFLVKTITLVAAIMVIAAFITNLACKSKRNEDRLEITKLNEDYENVKDTLDQVVLEKSEYKKLCKERKKAAKQKDDKHKPSLFVLDFEGDIRASDVTLLREEITAVLSKATAKDEVLVMVESAGGLVHSYGLAASQLDRVRKRDIPLTVAIDKVAASGGYMMASVANKIIAAPFAVLGSIGVVAQLPNFHRLLDKHNIDFEQHTAGEYKRTLTMFGKNTNEDRKRFQEELEETQVLFKDFVKSHRDSVDIDAVATGKHWYGTDALKENLVDQLITSDDYIYSKLDTHHIFKLQYVSKKPLGEKLSHMLSKITDGVKL